MGSGAPDCPGALEGREKPRFSKPTWCRFSTSYSNQGARLAGREPGPNAFPRGPPGNELFRAELGCGQRSSGELDQDKGLRTLGSTVAHILLLYHLSSNAPRQRLKWIQSIRPCLQKLARGGEKRQKGPGGLLSSLSPRHLLSRGPFKPGTLGGNRKQGGMCVLGYL